MKLMSVYRRSDAWYLSSASRTTAGVWLETAPNQKLPGEVESEAFGKAIIQALEASRDSIPHPTDWKTDRFKPMLELAGVKSWSALVKGTASVLVSSDESGFTIEPCKNEGPRDGYSFLPHKNLSLTAGSTPKQIGEAVKRAITLCE